MDLEKFLDNPYVQGVILLIGLGIYLLSPDDSIRLLSGAFVAALIIGMVLFEIKEGAKEHGWKNEVKDTLVTLLIAVGIWFAIQFLLNTSSPISAVVTCSMLPNLQRGDFAVVQGAPITAYNIEMTPDEFHSIKQDAIFSHNGTEYKVKGSLYSYCIFTRPELCKDFIADPTKFVETHGPFKFHYSLCSIDIRDKGKIAEPCVTNVEFKGKNYPVNISNDIIVYQPSKTEIYSLSGDIIHRAYFKINIANSSEIYYLTKGDNNQVLDIQVYDYIRNMGNDPIAHEKTKGKLLFRVPILGYYKLIISFYFTEPPQCKMTLNYQHLN